MWKQYTRRTIKKLLSVIFAICILLDLTGCSNKGHNYRYNSLASKKNINEFCDILTSSSVPAEDVNTILNFILIYSKESYAVKNLQGDWKNAKTKEHLYDYNEAITAYPDSKFNDLSCREAAYIIYNSFMSISNNFEAEINKNDSPLFSNLSMLNLERESLFYDCYEVLFCPFESKENVSDAVIDYWEEHGIKFESDDIHLVTLFGKKDEQIINIYCDVLLEYENSTYFFEKTDPVMPYQISVFESTKDMKTYLINRPGEDDYKDKTVFLGFKPL